MSELMMRLRVFAIQLGSLLLDCLFLAGWILVQSTFDEHILPIFRLNGFHAALVWILKITFAITTLAPVLAYIAVDVCSVGSRSIRAIKEVINQ